MTTLLHIDASARKERSITRDLGERFKRQWRAVQPTDRFIYRDIGSSPPDFISESWIAAVFTPEEKRTDEQNVLLSLSDLLIEELTEADVIVISTPMYNYGMPASLKAWIDQIVRINKTFTFDLDRGDFPLEPTLSGKSLVLLTACGEFGFGENGARETMNHLGPHLRTLSKYLGADDIHEIRVEYQEFGDKRHKRSIESAYESISGTINNIAEKLELRQELDATASLARKS
ncbi:FMN-dependent NADH-azoreductase [Amphritea atlantica]|uniref:FMN dependent NADH:quinone oxidoreductase n=1 Tax=Amphritea atlantica TaxID=355243 RepID=A0A1H9I6A0_9GAMM|nr:NAD(P)H-dependent oxidoreductase [Amphritea atlantica]SEQ70100.1 FMN-dependent NADH-azoreductase [Amphritea atlantica]